MGAGIAIAGGFGAGFAGTLASGGSMREAFRNGFYGGLTAGATFGIGHGSALASARDFANGSGRYLLHAGAQGTINQIRFNDFRVGAMGALDAGIAGRFHREGQLIRKSMKAAAFGGTFAQLGGG